MAKNVDKCALSRTSQEYVFRAPYDTTLGGEHFLELDSGVNDPNHVVIFCTKEEIWYLITSRIMYCDGIFKAVSHIFYQFYTLHSVVHDYVLISLCVSSV